MASDHEIKMRVLEHLSRKEESKTLIRYRFKTYSVDDPRPLIDLKEIQMPWWCSSWDGEMEYAICICYLPKEESLFKYWDDAFDIEQTEETEIVYTERFPKPKWIK